MYKLSTLGIALLALLFLGNCSLLKAQNIPAIKGNIVDTISKIKVKDASVSVLRRQDSILVSSARADGNGAFQFAHLPKGSYLLLISFPNYLNYSESFVLDSVQQRKDFGNVNLFRKDILLKEVQVKGSLPVRMKGDTIEYNADSYKTSVNASVEDLFKQLPGVEVDMNGNIKAQGKPISTVLVDGEEFFGDDPKLVTRNLRASMIDKVQIYDRKSEQAKLTGVNDGKTQKVMDVKLKENSKYGYFGKLDVGAGKGEGDEKYKNMQGMINSFHGKRKMAAYGMLNNVGDIGLSRGDKDKFSEGDNIYNANDLDTWSGRFDGIGIPNVGNAGLHYDNKWNDEKQKISANYKIGNMDVYGTQSSISQNNLPSTLLLTQGEQRSQNYVSRHGGNVAFNAKLDSMSNLSINANAAFVYKRTDDQNDSKTFENQTAINQSKRQIYGDSHSNAMGTSLNWARRFKKVGRSLSLDASFGYNDKNGYAILNADNQFFKNDSSSLINQYKTINTKGSNISGKLTYWEPLDTKNALMFNYGMSVNDAQSKLLSYDNTLGYQNRTLDAQFSNNYAYNQFGQSGGAQYSFKAEKYSFNVGLDAGYSQLNQKNLMDNTPLKRNFINWFPKASVNYAVGGGSLSFSYNGATNQPNLQQLQPIANNNDPLNLFLGNPNLKPTFNNDVSLSFMKFVFNNDKQTQMIIQTNFNTTNNPIVYSSSTNLTDGSNISRFINLNGRNNYNYTTWFYYSLKKNKAKWGGNININIDGNIYSTATNGDVNNLKSQSFQVSLGTSKRGGKYFDTSLSLGPQYNINSSSLQSQFNNNYWGFTLYHGAELNLPAKIKLNSEFIYTWQAKTISFPQPFSRAIWNMNASKAFTKKENFTIKLSANDLLNQNIGFTRNINNNYSFQNSYNTIRRYFMLSLIWDFNKTHGE